MTGAALPETDGDAAGTVVAGIDGDAVDGDPVDGDAGEGVAAADGEALPGDDGCAADEDGAAGADEDTAPRVAAGCEELLDTVLADTVLDDDPGLHPAATSAVTARTARTAVPRRHRTRIVNPPRPALLTGTLPMGYRQGGWFALNRYKRCELPLQ